MVAMGIGAGALDAGSSTEVSRSQDCSGDGQKQEKGRRVMNQGTVSQGNESGNNQSGGVTAAATTEGTKVMGMVDGGVGVGTQDLAVSADSEVAIVQNQEDGMNVANQGQAETAMLDGNGSMDDQVISGGQQSASATAGASQQVTTASGFGMTLHMTPCAAPKSDFISRSAAIQLLHVSTKAFDGLGLKPAKNVLSPYKGVQRTRLYLRSEVEGLIGTTAVAAGRSRKYARKDYGALFRQQYKTWKDALPDACKGIVELSDYTRNRSCKMATSICVDDLKAELSKVLYEAGGRRNVYWIRTIKNGKQCRECHGTGVNRNSGDSCRRCDGTGVWKDVQFVWNVQLEFEIAGHWYGLRVPKKALLFNPPTEKQKPVSTQTLLPAIGINPVERALAKQLVKWVIAERQATRQIKFPAKQNAAA